MMIDLREVEATGVEVEEGNADNVPHTLAGRRVHLDEWLDFQSRHMLHFVGQILSPDPQMREAAPEERDMPEARELAGRIAEGPANVIVGSAALKHLDSLPSAHALMEDWMARFGPLFRHTCKYEHIAIEDAGAALAEYQRRLIEHVQELRRVVHMHTREFPPVPALLGHVHSRVLGRGQDGRKGSFIEYGTMFPAVRTGEADEAEVLRHLAAAEQAPLRAAAEDPYAHPVEGCAAEQHRLLALILSEPGRSVVLDARPEHRYEDRLRVFKKTVVRVRKSA